MRVLIVEDDLPVAAALLAALRRRGHEVSHVTTVTEALAAPEVDIALLDVLLPDGNCLDICRELRHDGDQVAVVAVGGLTAEADRIRGLHSGADGYLSKPFSIAELIARLEAMMALEVHVASLRQKLGNPQFVETVCDVGYRLRVEIPRPSDCLNDA